MDLLNELKDLLSQEMVITIKKKNDIDLTIELFSARADFTIRHNEHSEKVLNDWYGKEIDFKELDIGALKLKWNGTKKT